MKRYLNSKYFMALLTCAVMILSLVSVKVHAEDEALTAPKVKMNNEIYDSLKEAVNAVENNGSATITLGKGKYTLYEKNVQNPTNMQGKTLTFVGQGIDQTEWGIGAEIPDPDKFGTEYNSDYSFKGSKSVTFKNMTMRSANKNYLGFAHTNDTVVEHCKITGQTFYWGYHSATFRDTTFDFNGGIGDYPLWVYSSNTMTIDGCTFNVKYGKVINVDADNQNGKTVVINYSNNTVNNSLFPQKSVLNIHDSLKACDYVVNISGKNVVNKMKVNKLTCSDLFQVENVPDKNNGHFAKVSIDGKTVWENGKMVSHSIDCANDKYTSGYKDNAFDITYGEWKNKDANTLERDVTKTCKYCGYQETIKEEKKIKKADLVIYKLNQDNELIKGATFRLVKDGQDISVIEDGPKYVFKDLTDGIYRVYETVAPSGYEGLSTYFEIEIKDGKMYYDGKVEDNMQVINTNDGTTPRVLGAEIDIEEGPKTEVEPKTEAEPKTEVKGAETETETSDNQNMYEYGAVAIISMLGILFLITRRKASNK